MVSKAEGLGEALAEGSGPVDEAAVEALAAPRDFGSVTSVVAQPAAAVSRTAGTATLENTLDLRLPIRMTKPYARNNKPPDQVSEGSLVLRNHTVSEGGLEPPRHGLRPSLYTSRFRTLER